MSREISDLQDEIIEDVIVEDEVDQDDVEVGDVTYVPIVYSGGETDNIIVNVDNDNRIITATVKPIQFVSRETFPETGSERLLYVSTSDNITWRWDSELNDYVMVGKDYTTELAEMKANIQQNANEIQRLDQEIIDINSEITDIQAKDVEQDLLLTSIEEANKDRDTKINALETKSAEHEQDLAANEKAIQANSDEIAKNAAQIEENKTSIQTNADNISKNTSAIEQNTKDISDNKTAIATNASNIDKNAKAIEANATAIATLTDESGNSIEFSVDPLTYILTLNLKNKAGDIISTGTVDLPLETMVVSASYKDGTLTLTLQNGQTVDIDISNIIDGLVSQQAFDDEITRIDGEITTLQGEVTAHDLTLTAIEEANKDRDTKINSLETSRAEHEQELADYEVRIGESENAISDLQEQDDGIEEDLTNLTSRVATNEASISDIKQEQTTQNDSIKQLQEKTDASNTSISELTQRVETNETNISNNASSIEALNTKTDATNQNVSDLSDRVDEHDTLISQKANQTELISTAEELRDEISKKQDKLTAGANITITDTNVISANIPDETDPTVPQHVKDIIEDDIANWNAKIDQEGLETYTYDKTTIDSKFTATNNNVSDLTTKYNSLNTQVSNNTKSIEGHTTDIAGLRSGLEAANGNITDLQGSVQTAQGDITDLQADVTEIQGKIPTQASATNQLADKSFVNSSINNLAAFYITKNAKGEAFATYAELEGTSTFYSGGQVRTPTTNDYAIVQADETKADELGDHPTTRYTYQGGQWEFQYIVNRTSLTAAQIAAINSGITTDLVAQIGTNKSSITSLTSRVGAAETKNANQDTSISSLQTSKADKTEIPRPLWLADSVILTDAGIDADYTIAKKNIQPLVATGYTIMASDKIMFMTEKATYLGVVKSTNGDNVVAMPKFDMATVSFVEKNAGGGADGAVLYTEQSLTTDQQTQARENIGAGTSNFDGKYASLTGAPTLGSLASKSSITNADVSDSAAIAQSKIANLTTDLAAKATTTALNAVKATADAAFPKAGGAIDGNTTVGGTLSSYDTLAALTRYGNAFELKFDGNTGLELGRKDGTKGSAYIDFHTDGQEKTDFNVRMIANGTQLQIKATGGITLNDGVIQYDASTKTFTI